MRRPKPQRLRADFLTSIAAARQEVQNLFELAQDLGTAERTRRFPSWLSAPSA